MLYLENHDQVANSGLGARLSTLTAPDQLRAMTALMLLAPGTPMLFQGQEFGSTRPFVYFADHDDELARAVAKGRREFLAQFPSLADPEVQQRIPDPAAPETFACCKLDWSERDRHGQIWDLHRDLLRLRREEPAFAAQDATDLLTAVLGAEAMLLRYRCASGDRLLLVNLGTDLHLDVAPEPLLAPPLGAALADALVQRGPALWRSRDGRRRDRRRVSPPRTCRGGPGPEERHERRRSKDAQPPEPDRSPISRPVRIGWRRGDATEALVSREWLLTNGLGGYACGTVGGVLTRRYHSLLVAALPAPAGRTTMLNQLGETLRLADGTVIALGGFEPGNGQLLLPEALVEFRLDNGRPVWRFEQAGVTLEKRIVLTHHQNTTRIAYRLLEGSAPATLVLEPAVDFRGHDDRVDRGGAATDYTIAAGRNGVRIARADGASAPAAPDHAHRARARPVRAAAPRHRRCTTGSSRRAAMRAAASCTRSACSSCSSPPARRRS